MPSVLEKDIVNNALIRSKILEPETCSKEDLQNNMQDFQKIFASMYYDKDVSLEQLQAFNNKAKSLGQQKDFFEYCGENIIAHQLKSNPNLKIKDLRLLATHDSGATAPHNIFQNPPANLLNGKKKYLFYFFKYTLILPVIEKLIRPIVSKWVQCQGKSIEEQLKSGVRMFDFRVAKDAKGEIYLAHSLLCQPLAKSLEAIKAFKKEHPEEIIIINIKPDNLAKQLGSDKDFVRKLEKQISSAVGEFCLNNATRDFEVLNSQKKAPIIFSAQDFKNATPAGVLSSSLTKEIWPNTDNPANLQEKLEDVAKKKATESQSKSKKPLYYLSGALTPNVKTILKNFFSRGNKDLAAKAPEVTIPSCLTQGDYRVVGVMQDFVEGPQMPKTRNFLRKATVHMNERAQTQERESVKSKSQERSKDLPKKQLPKRNPSFVDNVNEQRTDKESVAPKSLGQ